MNTSLETPLYPFRKPLNKRMFRAALLRKSLGLGILAGLMVSAGVVACIASVSSESLPRKADLPVQTQFLPASDPRIEYSDYVHKIVDPVEGSVRFDRGLDTGRGFRWHSPGTRVRWRTNSAVLTVRLRFTDDLASARNSIGYWRIDGVEKGRFQRPAAGSLLLDLPIVTSPGAGLHDYELVLPYGDSVSILGIEAARVADWARPSPRPDTRYLAFGDSITHGFTASDVTRSYAFKLAEASGWELVNLGIGGRGTGASDAANITAQDADVISILIGVNDWQGGADIEQFRQNIRGLLRGIRAVQPETPLLVMTPLWVPESWQPAAANRPLEDYRQVIREEFAALEDAHALLVDGPTLIDHDPALFDKVAVHPNDAGFAQMTQRLLGHMRRLCGAASSQ